MINSTALGLGNLVRCALEAQVSPDTTIDDVSTPCVLVLAAAHGATRALKALLAGGANTELVDKDGNTALALTAGFGHLSCLQLLLEAGGERKLARLARKYTADAGGNV